MSAPFCGDCPDHEACMTGFTCEQVRAALCSGPGPQPYEGPQFGRQLEPCPVCGTMHEDQEPAPSRNSRADTIGFWVAFIVGFAGALWFSWEVFLR